MKLDLIEVTYVFILDRGKIKAKTQLLKNQPKWKLILVETSGLEVRFSNVNFYREQYLSIPKTLKENSLI